jgi:ketosteroid isomerase-like protein
VSNLEVVKEIYRAFGRGDVPGVLARFHADAEWRLAEGHPYAPDGEAWIGPGEIARRFFMRAGSEWEGFSLAPGRWHDAGETVVLECRYAGTYRLTGKRLDAQACHVWTVRDGKIQRFQQYINTVHLRDVMGAA